MKWFQSLSIRNKLMVIILSVSLGVVVLLGMAMILWEYNQSKNQLINELTTITKLVGNRSSAALAFDDSLLAEENLTSLQTMPNIQIACLYRSDGTLMANYISSTNQILECPEVVDPDVETQAFESNYATLSQPIQENGLTVGTIHIGSNLSKLKSRVENQVVFSGFALLISAYLVWLLASRLQRIISAPLGRITDVAKTIQEKGDHSIRAPVLGTDEVGQLAASFNSMLDALDEQNEKLRRSQKMEALGKFTGGVAHDYNNMLGVVLGYKELLEGALGHDPKHQKFVQQIKRAGERGAQLTAKLLAFSRKKAGELVVLNINDLLHEEQTMLEKVLTARISLKLDLTDGLWPVYLDEGDLEDAILNMCINAMHATENSGDITVKTENVDVTEQMAIHMQAEAGEYVMLSIIDNGCGMDRKTVEKIFDPFFSTKGDKGTGLGLSQVYGLVQRSGGSVEVYSEINEGTRFNLYFPRHMDDVVKEDTEDRVERPDYIGSGTILVVDDEPALLDLCAEILSPVGYDVIKANGANEALSILEEQSIDLVITDVIMPEMDGYALAAQIQDKYPGVKIQVASGFSDERYEANMNVEGDLHEQLLAKPYNAQALKRRVRRLLR